MNQAARALLEPLGLAEDPLWAGEADYVERSLAAPGEHGFPNHRIPALAVTTAGTVIASWDGRPTWIDAPGPNSILQRRSHDNGATWGEVEVVRAGSIDEPQQGYSDPSLLVDRVTGSVFNIHVHSMDVGLLDSRAGTAPDDRGVMHMELSRSDDDGCTWAHRDITPEIVTSAGERSRFATSGAGIQLRQGSWAGRLVQQCCLIDADGRWRAVSLLSDDHGESWYPGQPVGEQMDENKTVELSDGRVLLNSRDKGGSGLRKSALSTDGGASFGPVRLEPQLVDPANNGSLIRVFPDAEAGSPRSKVLLFSNAASVTERAHGTVRLSVDDGETWPVGREWTSGRMDYSTLAMLDDGRIGLLYEPGPNGIIFASFTPAWLFG